MAEAAFCRICFESGEPSSFITPCRCRGDAHTGSQKHVHAACLSAWLRTLPQGTAHCSVCQSAFYVRPSLLPFLVKLCCGSRYASCCALVLAAICLAPLALCVLGFMVVFTLGCHALGYRPELTRVTATAEGRQNAARPFAHRSAPALAAPRHSSLSHRPHRRRHLRPLPCASGQIFPLRRRYWSDTEPHFRGRRVAARAALRRSCEPGDTKGATHSCGSGGLL